MLSTALAMGIAIPMAQAETVPDAPKPRVCTEFQESDAVFVATVLEERQADGVTYYKVRTLRDYHGGLPFEFEVATSSDIGTRLLIIHEHYLLFARQKDDKLWIYSGGNSGALSDVDDALAEISRLVTVPGGSIYGHVRGDDVEGIVFYAVGEAGYFTGVTDDEGRFEIGVPPGSYSVKPAEEFARVRPDDLSRDRAEEMEIKGGYCADLSFVSGN